MGPFDYQPFRPSWRRRERRPGLDRVVWRGIGTAVLIMLASASLAWLVAVAMHGIAD